MIAAQGPLVPWLGGRCLGAFCCFARLACMPRTVLMRTERSREQLRTGRLTATIRRKREELLVLFRAWLALSLGSLSLEYLARHDATCLGSWCEEFVVQAFLEKWGRTKTAETLLAICDAAPVMKGMLGAAWAALRTWEMLEPPDLHPPAPLKILQAMVVCAGCWRWWDMAATLWVGFWCLLRPSEYLSLSSGDFSWP